MNCQNIQKKLFAYLDHELPETALGEIHAHLETCSACRALLARHRQLTSILVETPAPEVPNNLTERLLDQANRQSTPPRHLSTSLKWYSGVLPQRVAAAAILAIGLSLGSFMGRSTWKKPPTPPNVQLVSQADPVETYNFDYLNSAPDGSMEQAFLTLTSMSDEIEVKK